MAEASLASTRARQASPYLTVAALLLVLPLAGFWRPYFQPLSQGAPLEPFVDFWVIHVHAALFSTWMIGLVVQTALVRRGRARLHRRLGLGLAAFGSAAAAFGLFATIALAVRRIEMGLPLDRAASFLIAGLTDMVVFAGFLLAALAFRHRPETHKRLMILATFTIALVGGARVIVHFAPFLFDYEILGYRWLATLVLFSPLFLLALGDVLTRRSIHPAYVAGLLVFALMSLRPQISQTEVWLSVGRAILSPFAASH